MDQRIPHSIASTDMWKPIVFAAILAVAQVVNAQDDGTDIGVDRGLCERCKFPI